MNAPVRLSELLEFSSLAHTLVFLKDGRPFPLPDIEITSIRHDSRVCDQGSIYCAFRGLHEDGIDFMDNALEKGAAAVVTDRLPSRPHEGVPYIVVEAPRQAYALLCGSFFGNPASALKVIGVTGTDGKSTTIEYLWQLLRGQGVRAGLLSTVSWDDGSGLVSSPYRQSTPEAWELHSFLSSCRDHGLSIVILETTSHALSMEYDRLAGIAFSGAIYTTMTSEHLEFHGSLERYVDAKLNLARRLLPGSPLVIPHDNARKDDIMKAAPQAKPFITAVHHGKSSGCSRKEDGILNGTCISATVLGMEPEQLAFTFAINDKELTTLWRFPSPFPFLLSNALEAAAMAHSLIDIPLEAIIAQFEKLSPVRGRAIPVPNSLGVTVLIDFAHTADAFAHVMEEISRVHPKADITVVFGAAGERDTTKRAPMGAQAARWCSRIIITDEDPRNEGYEAIRKDIEAGIPDALKRRRTILRIADRKRAIREAVANLNRGDVLLLLGKGHETTIEYENGRKIPWDEMREAREALAVCAACREGSSL
ncbi:Mur ligase family protein [Parasphaerochaeta coccoides]|uniref:UDP-N-acetylmuramyl-tripeptide synthetase n=1 Tax=Parasphaerochaeta coccoides (strain ATCC BAA-1237 / DSM 17374 / SPN1) TaxID=760011 RepID=F4GIK0_PARC1|nr:UDP-N-acetylmuramyl-tripeptide synthetase [Parasphaerochaeta coccoides]AEC02134.1 UDP-N-acetylmuramoyl-L-alanyl-D-glutamate--2,6-d iaminopimelate ligase [Parasphaerochaeta coccoides DSM 17374]